MNRPYFLPARSLRFRREKNFSARDSHVLFRRVSGQARLRGLAMPQYNRLYSLIYFIDGAI